MKYRELFEARKQVGQNIRKLVIDEGYSKTFFAEKIGVSRPTLDKLMEGSVNNPNFFERHIDRVLSATGWNAQDLLMDDGTTLENDVAIEGLRKLPIGIQSFEKIRKGGFIYVDKTEYIYKLVHSGIPYFLSRPRRFGKSLLVSTLKAYWEGKKELFNGLAIERLEEIDGGSWEAYPVFCFDFSREGYQSENALEEVLDTCLKEWEAIYGCDDPDRSPAIRFQNLIKRAVKQTGKPCVVLVDEYDKPILDIFENKELSEHNRDVFKGFFSCLKGFDDYLKFVFITGVTKFNKVSIFSDLNQLDDITFDNAYAGLCGITEEELGRYFATEIEEVARTRNISTTDCRDRLRRSYDGYCFSSDMLGIYNPYSLLKSFSKKQFGSYWFETGTPSFLLKKVKDLSFDVKSFNDGSLFITEKNIADYRADDDNPVPLLYQTGYLTILGYDDIRESYRIGFPNDEVRYGFLENLMDVYAKGIGAGTGKDILSIDHAIENGDVEAFMNAVTALFASIPYSSADTVFEHYFQAVLYMLFTMLGKYVICELHTYSGRVDCVVETRGYVYIFEFKRDGSVDEAIEQIEKMKYDLPYAADKRILYKIGVSFDSEKRTLSEWKLA
ncbi:AAA family ATPase [Butyrivibrio sp. MC2013]|uniref:AAA family ATPase n=1 Tax=Butyrivibrio sp. MC2013 TaxID=1280686 RepID=UPI000420AC06|nr:AAA family ATPase [Butyrivibrio sp. MC2013]